MNADVRDEVAKRASLIQDGSRDNKGSHADISGLAPLPDRPSLYPIDSTYYVVPVTFDIEILTLPIAADSDTSADRGWRGEGVGS